MHVDQMASALQWYPAPDYVNMSFERAPPLFSQQQKKPPASPYGNPKPAAPAGGGVSASPRTRASLGAAGGAATAVNGKVMAMHVSPRAYPHQPSTGTGGGTPAKASGRPSPNKKVPAASGRAVPLSSLVTFPQFNAGSAAGSGGGGKPKKGSQTARSGGSSVRRPAMGVAGSGSSLYSPTARDSLTGSAGGGLDDDLAARLTGNAPPLRLSTSAGSAGGDPPGGDGNSAAVREKVANALRELDELKSALSATPRGSAAVSGGSSTGGGHFRNESKSSPKQQSTTAAMAAAAAASSAHHSPGVVGDKETRINLSRIQSLMKKLYQKNMELSQQIHSLREENNRLSKGGSTSLSALRMASISSTAVVNATLAHATATAAGTTAGAGTGPTTTEANSAGLSRAELLSLIAARDQSIQQLKTQHNTLRERIEQFERDRSFIYPPNYGVPFVAGAKPNVPPLPSAAADTKSDAKSIASATARHEVEYDDLYTELSDKIDAYVRQQTNNNVSSQTQLVLEASARRLERMCYNDQLLQYSQAASEEFVRRSTLEAKLLAQLSAPTGTTAQQ